MEKSAAVRAVAAPKVFLSYAHVEMEIALALREALSSCGLDILMDVDLLKPGDDITQFARQSVKSADATLCIVSAASLSSAWVVFEAVTTLHKESTNPDSRLIACAVDESFFDPEIRIKVTREIDKKVSGINQLIPEYLAKELDFADLSLERSRLLSMRNSLGDVLVRLRNSLTLPLKIQTLAETAAQVADHIRGLRGQMPSRTDPRDIRARAEELRRYLWDDRTDDALDRLLDFVREFSDEPKYVRDAISLANTLRRIDRAEKEKGLGFEAAEGQRQPAIYKLLVLIDEIEVHPQLSAVG